MAFDGPVCLTQSAPIDAYSGQLIFYDVVHSSAMARSAVLSCIVEAGGEAVLPDSVTLAEFKTWLRQGNAARTEAETWSFSVLCTVMKVADVLDDGRVGEWIQLAAATLLHESTHLDEDCRPEVLSIECLNTQHMSEPRTILWHSTARNAARCRQQQWHKGRKSPTLAPADEPAHKVISDGLAELSDSLRRRVFAAAAIDPSCLHLVVDFLPSLDHAAVLEATVSHTRTLVSPLSESLKAAKALVSLPASPPAFVSLSVHDLEHSERVAAGLPTDEEAATCLAQALQHHSGLTSLQMALPAIVPASLKQLATAIASLSSLQSLHLHTKIGPDFLPTLRQTFQCLPQLQHLAISLYAKDTPKRPRDDETAPLPQHCLVPMLSAASGLTSLDLSTVYNTTSSFAATSALFMPHLRQLALRFHSFHTRSCASILGALRAPLTTLNLLDDGVYLLCTEVLADVQMLYASLATFTSLQTLALSTPTDHPMAFPMTPSEAHDHHMRDILDAVSSGCATLIAALPRLTSLNLNADLAVTRCAAPVMATALTQLTDLTVTMSQWGSERADWRALLTQLAQPRLQLLRMTPPDQFQEPVGLAALPRMPHLTALSLDRWGCIARRGDCEALGRMTQLRQLHLLRVRLPGHLRGGCARCLGELPALTSLVFRSATAGGCISGLLDEHVPAGALPALQELGLDVWGRFAGPRNEDDEAAAGEGFADTAAVGTVSRAGRFAARLPALVRLDLALRDDGSRGPLDDLSEAVHAIKRKSGRELEVSQTAMRPVKLWQRGWVLL